MEWDTRMQNTRSVEILKTVIPFFDVPVGEPINLEGVLEALLPFVEGRARRIIDLFLQLGQMRRMMEMVQMMQAMQEFQQASQEAGNGESQGENPDDSHGGGDGFGPDMMEMLKTMMPAEQQENFEMISAMMSMMSPTSMMSPASMMSPDEQAESGGDDGTVNL